MKKKRVANYWKNWPSMKKVAVMRTAKWHRIHKQILQISNEYAQDGSIIPLRDAIKDLCLDIILRINL